MMTKQVWRRTGAGGLARRWWACPVCVAFAVGGCGLLGPFGQLHGDCWDTLLVQGHVLDLDAMRPLVQSAVGGRTFTDGEETDSRSALISGGTPRFPAPSADGSFQVEFITPFMPCTTPPVLEFPVPDQVEIIVVRDDCEQTFLIDINEGTAVFTDDADGAIPHDVLELRDPILVPACDE